MIKVYSHPRSGTHFLMSLIGDNFYPDENLEKDARVFGHWSRLEELDKPVANGQLFGSHSFVLKRHRYLPVKRIYIYRDGRDVAFSMWNSKFYNSSWGDISFSDYLKKNIDWFSSPTFKSDDNLTILEHWRNHVSGWLNTNDYFILKLRYEEVLLNPENTVKQIGRFLNLPLPSQIKNVDQLVGLSPNKGKIHKWKSHLKKEDHDYIRNLIPDAHSYFWET